MGLAFTSGNQTLMYIGIGVGALFLILMGGAHHIIVAVVALAALFIGFQTYKSTGQEEYLLYALLIAGGIFVLFVLHGKEDSQTGGMDAYGGGAGGGMGLPMGY